MKRTIRKVFQILLLSTVLISCELETKKKPVKTINLSSTYEEIYDVKLSEIATDIDYIKLETKESSIISKISNPKNHILFSQNHILIKDKREVLLLFKKNGEFIRKIDNKGRGPGEYTRIADIAILSEKKRIVIIDRVIRKALLYNLKGDFINEIPLKFFQNTVMEFNEDLIFRNSVRFRKNSDYYTFNAYDTDGEFLKKFHYKEIEKETKGIKTFLGGFAYSSLVLNDTLTYWEKNGFSKKDTVWSISKDFKVLPKYVIDLGGERISSERMKKSTKLSWEDHIKWNELLKYLESDKYIFFDIKAKKEYVRLYTNKSGFESKRVSDVDNTKKYVSGEFLNDIDGGLCFWPEGKVSNNKVFSMVSGSAIKKYIKKQGEDYEVLNLKAREKLLNITKNVKVTDNPILMIVTLKE